MEGNRGMLLEDHNDSLLVKKKKKERKKEKKKKQKKKLCHVCSLWDRESQCDRVAYISFGRILFYTIKIFSTSASLLCVFYSVLHEQTRLMHTLCCSNLLFSSLFDVFYLLKFFQDEYMCLFYTAQLLTACSVIEVVTWEK